VYGPGRLSPHSSLRLAFQWPSATEAGPLPKPDRPPAAGAAGRRTGRKATPSDASLPLLRRSHDDHRRVDPDPAGLPTSMGRQLTIIPRAPSVQRSASVCRTAARLVLWPIVPERRRAQQYQWFDQYKPADRPVNDTAMTANNLLPDLSTRSGKVDLPKCHPPLRLNPHSAKQPAPSLSPASMRSDQ